MNNANEMTLQSDRLRVRFIRHAEHMSVAVEDLVRGRHWCPVPLLALEVHEKALRRKATRDSPPGRNDVTKGRAGLPDPPRVATRIAGKIV